MRAAATVPATTAASVQRKLHRSAASTARPLSSAMKLDCEKVGTRPAQRIATRPLSSARLRLSLAHSRAAIATTMTRAR